MGLDVTPHLLGTPAPSTTADDPEVERVKAVLESRLMGGPQQPTHIGRFVVLERVGAGGMGVVYAAFDPQLDRKVAIKLLFEGGSDERERARLLGEAKAMAKLAHPNVVGVYEVGEHQGRVFVAMEYIRGRTLKRWRKERTRTWRETLAMSVQAGQGLAAAHAAGIVHRDFKADNVIVGDDDRARVVDFGLAQQAAEEHTDPGSSAVASSASDSALTKLTRTGTLVGTPAYMAPEQIRGEVVDAQADQFAFCVATWEAFAGERPFAGDTVKTLFEHVTRSELREPPRRAMPSWVTAVLRRGLAPKPHQRHPSMHALLAALERGASRRRRGSWFAAAGVAVLAGLGTWGAWHLELERRRSQCESDADAITEVWNDGAKTELHDALVATGVPFAESTFDHATPFVDAHVEAWRRDYAELCVATEVQRERTPESWAASRSCLHERRGELGALLDVLTNDADATAAQRTVAAVAGLTRLDVCRDDAWLARNVSVAGDDRELDDERVQFWRAGGLDAAGKYSEALQLARSVADAAAAGERPRLHRSALFLAGAAAQHAGAADDATQLLAQAFDLSLAAGDDDLARAAATELVPTINQTRDYESAFWWGRVARGLEARSGSDEDLAAARLDEALALAHMRRDDTGSWTGERGLEAERLLGRALAIRERLQGPDHPDVGRLLVVVADVEALKRALSGVVEDGAERESITRRGVTIQENALGPDHPDVARSLIRLGSAQFWRTEYDEAQRTLERADAILTKTSPDHEDRAPLLWYLGAIHQNRRSYEEADEVMERLIALSERTTRAGLPQALCDLATNHVARGSYDEAQTLYERGLALAEHEVDPANESRAQCLAFLANLHALRGSYDESRRLHERALAIVETTRLELFTTPYLDLFGNMHALQGTHREAAHLYERSLEIQARWLGPDWPGQATTLVRLGRVALHLHGPARARAHAERAIELVNSNEGRGLATFIVVDDHGCMNQFMDPGVVPSAQFVLAMAAWSSGDRSQARELAVQARDALRDAGEGFQRKLAEVEAWIAAHADASKD